MNVDADDADHEETITKEKSSKTNKSSQPASPSEREEKTVGNLPVLFAKNDNGQQSHERNLEDCFSLRCLALLSFSFFLFFFPFLFSSTQRVRVRPRSKVPNVKK